MTLYQLPHVLSHRGSQPIRSLLASLDILFATFISNAVVLLSLLQDKGYKKAKYKHGTTKAGFHTKGSTATGLGGISGSGMGAVDGRPLSRWGSDENLMRKGGLEDGKSVFISMEVLKGDGKSSKGSSDGDGDTMGELPNMPRAQLKEIRVASTWEVHVERDEGR
jgi:hypothetical protein